MWDYDNIFLICAPYINSCVNLSHLNEAVLTSTHNLSLQSKVRKILYSPVNLTFSYIIWGFQHVHYVHSLSLVNLMRL